MNLKKTKIIQFKPTQKKPLELNLKTVTSTSNNIEEVKEFNLLGITIDSGINWKAHIQNIKTKLCKFVYALNVLKTNTSLECALSAYYAYAHSWLQYGVVLWGGSTGAQQLFVMQKKCVRILAHVRIPNSCRPYFIKLKLLTLPCIYILQTALFVHENPYLFKKKKILRQPERSIEISYCYQKLTWQFIKIVHIINVLSLQIKSRKQLNKNVTKKYLKTN
jgi:hypothetical protein